MAIKKEQLHPEFSEDIIYPETSSDQIVDASSIPISERVVKYDFSGFFNVSDPVDLYNPTTKQYVDDKVYVVQSDITGIRLELSSVQNSLTVGLNSLNDDINNLEAGLDDYVRKNNSPDTVYGVDTMGENTNYNATSNPYPLSVVFRDSDGNFQTEDPVAIYDVANKRYVDNSRKGVMYCIFDNITGVTFSIKANVAANTTFDEFINGLVPARQSSPRVELTYNFMIYSYTDFGFLSGEYLPKCPVIFSVNIVKIVNQPATITLKFITNRPSEVSEYILSDYSVATTYNVE